MDMARCILTYISQLLATVMWVSAFHVPSKGLTLDMVIVPTGLSPLSFVPDSPG